MTKEQALEILAQAINKAATTFNSMELFAIQTAFLKLEETLKDEQPRENKD
jgi:hypothetical protein